MFTAFEKKFENEEIIKKVFLRLNHNLISNNLNRNEVKFDLGVKSQITNNVILQTKVIYNEGESEPRYFYKIKLSVRN